MFGISFTEITLVAIVALIVVGPAKLPVMLRTLGQWISSARRFTTQVRAQTGIDELLRDEGITGGINELRELRGMLRGDISRLGYRSSNPTLAQADPYLDSMEVDNSREYPLEGADAMGALPDDLADDIQQSPASAREGTGTGVEE